ncbi:MAG: alpha-2-macroglobulin family protein, partial [Gammaproteobacteria bacterium]
LFKFVSYWNPAIRPDREGRATIRFQAPDNLTGWRVFAMAATASDRMGLGEQSFKVNKPTELRPVMPNQVIEGDSFAAGFSVMNRTEEARRLSFRIAAWPIEPGNAEIARELRLEPFKRKTVWLPLTTRSPGEIAFKAAAGHARDKDAILYRVPVRKALE